MSKPLVFLLFISRSESSLRAVDTTEELAGFLPFRLLSADDWLRGASFALSVVGYRSVGDV
jgi:hypothetical protein